MSDREQPPDDGAPHEGARTAAEGTPVPVDMARDVQVRRSWAALLGGPVVWFLHFMVVYLVAEAGCTGGGPGLRLLDPPVPAITTAVATVVALLACGVLTARNHRRWRAEDPPTTDRSAPGLHELDRHRELGFVGLLLAVLSAVAVLFVAAPALAFASC